jgi:hypothetical protein
LTRSETWIDAVTAEGASLILQSYDFTNTGDRIYIGDDLGRPLTIPLPDATLNSAIDAIPNPPGRFILERDGDSATYYDTQPVYPGAAGRIATSFDLRYEGTMQIVQGFAYPMLDATVFVSEVRGLQLESDQLEEAGTGSLNDLTYRGFALSAEELPPGSDLTYRVFDGQPPAAAAPGVPSAGGDESTWSLSNNAGLILGLGVLLIIGGGMFLFYDLQRRRMELESESLPPTLVDEEDLIAAMAALDEAYEAGNISEGAYQNRRQALKEALRDRMR